MHKSGGHCTECPPGTALINLPRMSPHSKQLVQWPADIALILTDRVEMSERDQLDLAQGIDRRETGERESGGMGERNEREVEMPKAIYHLP